MSRATGTATAARWLDPALPYRQAPRPASGLIAVVAAPANPSWAGEVFGDGAAQPPGANR